METPCDQPGSVPPPHPDDRQPRSIRTAPAARIIQVPGLWFKDGSECWELKMLSAALLMSLWSEIGSWTMGQRQKKQRHQDSRFYSALRSQRAKATKSSQSKGSIVFKDNASLKVCYLQTLKSLFIFPPRILLLFTFTQTTLILKPLHFFFLNSFI